MVRYLKYLAPLLIVAPFIEGGNADVSVATHELPDPPFSKKDTSNLVGEMSKASPERSPTQETSGVNQGVSDSIRAGAIAKKQAEMLAQYEEILEGAAQELALRTAAVKALRAQMVMTSESSSQSRPQEKKLSREVKPPLDVEEPAFIPRTTQSMVRSSAMPQPMNSSPQSPASTVDEHGESLEHEIPETRIPSLSQQQKDNPEKPTMVTAVQPEKLRTLKEDSASYVVP